MRPYRFQLAQDQELHFFGPDGAPIAQRPVEPAGVETLVAEVEAEYCPGSQRLGTLGRRLFDWLNGPEAWLAAARAAGPGVAVHLDLPGPVGRLPWELLCQDGLFLASATQNPFTPVRRVGTQSAGSWRPRATNRPSGFWTISSRTSSTSRTARSGSIPAAGPCSSPRRGPCSATCWRRSARRPPTPGS